MGGECGFTRTGFVMIVPRRFAEQLSANVSMHQRLGIPSLLIGADDVSRLAPDFYTDDFDSAAYEPESGYADPAGTTSAFLDAARSNGAELIQGCEVTGLHTAGGRVTGVETSGGDISAPLVVNAAGPWAGKVARQAGVEVPIQTWRHDTMFVLRSSANIRDHPAVIDDINKMYFRPETGRLTLVGLEDGNPIGLNIEDSSERALPGFVERAVNRICNRIPAMETASVHSAHGGIDGITPDQRAVIGPAGPEGYYLSCGYSGTGFKIAPAVGAALTELILDGEAHTADISPFDPGRFQRDELIETETGYGNIWKD